MTIGKWAAALLAGAAIASTAVAQEPGSRQTREFVQAAAESDTFEIIEAQTALAQTTVPQILAFARQMVHDHGETSRALQEATARAGLKPPPMAVGANQAPFLAALQSMRGPDFDQTFWRQQAMAHRAALTVEQGYATSGDTPAIRQAATAAIPTIKAHLTMAEQMVAKLGGS